MASGREPERAPGGPRHARRSDRGEAATARERTGAHRFTNRLAGQKSPYLLQHAHNPVDWRPWGEEAFDLARRLDRPIFLSIGYSTCHWCHVMERESFEDEDLAGLLNEHFVPIKVDREERPDVDRVYMTYVQAVTGSGGWPLTVFLTPDLRPFGGGTYFPPRALHGMPGLRDILLRVRDAWLVDRPRLAEAAAEATAMLAQLAGVRPGPAAERADSEPAGRTDSVAKGRDTPSPAEPAAPPLALAGRQLRDSFDSAHGGFGSAPKFPQATTLDLLLRCRVRLGDAKAREMALRTLRAIAAGGIHDHLGGGFHRYSTDARWFLPHFEKMLYDQAQLASSFLAAWQLTHEDDLADLARDALDYVLSELRGPDGEFLSAVDADSAASADAPHERLEGRYYVWTAGEIERVLGPRAASLFAHRYGVLPRGNVSADPRGELAGLNVLSCAHTIEETARRFGLSADRVREELAAACAKLFAVRSRRPRPAVDDKAVTSWNGLAISAFARAGAALGEPRYLHAAARAAALVHTQLYDARAGLLRRRLREGEAAGAGVLDDYAFFIQGMLDLYEATLAADWLRTALELQRRQDALFRDASEGGYFSTDGRDRSVLVRAKDFVDAAEPSGNAVTAMNLLRLAAMTADDSLAGKARRTLDFFAAPLRDHPAAAPALLSAADFAAGPVTQIVLAGDPADPATRALLHEAHFHYLPNKVVLGAGGEGQSLFTGRIEGFESFRPGDGKPAAYVCRHFTCRPPVTDPRELRAVLAEPE